MILKREVMKNARERRGLSQTELADKIGVSIPVIVRAEGGKNIKNRTGRFLCEYLGVDLEKAVVPRFDEGPVPAGEDIVPDFEEQRRN
jgi:ribosome-binding protein aMBF1 (putative translation factor)